MTFKRDMLSASRWTTSSTILRVILQYAQTMILARLLTPSDFGHMAIIAALIAIVGIIADFGISNALIHFQTPDSDILSSLYWINMIISFLLMTLFILIANPIASFYNTPELYIPLLLVSVIFPIGAIGNQFKVLAEKEFRFTKLIWIEVFSALSAFLTTIILATNGYGIYSIIAAIISSTSIKSILFFIFLSKNYRIKFILNLSGLGNYFRYGTYKLCETFINTVNSQSDIFLGGYFFGASNIGIYSTPRDQNLNIANNFVNPIVTRISTPAMAKVQHDKKSLKEIYLLALRMTSSINFPIYAFICFFATDIIAILLGPQWKDACFYMTIFAIWGAIRSVGNPTGSLLYSTGNVRRAFWWNLALIITTFTILTFSLSQGELEGLSIGMLATQFIIFIPAWRYLVYPICDAKLGEYFSQLFPPFIAAATSGLIAWLWINNMSTENSFVRIIYSTMIFGFFYMLMSMLINRPWIFAMKKFLNL